MSIIPRPDAPYLVELPLHARLTEVLVRVAPPPGPETPAPPPDAAPREDPPAFPEAAAPPPEDAFPTRAELDAILAALTVPPPAPDAQARAELVAVFGLDPVIAADPALFEAALAGLPDPDSGALKQQWLSEAGAVPPGPDPFPVLPDWLLG